MKAEYSGPARSIYDALVKKNLLRQTGTTERQRKAEVCVLIDAELHRHRIIASALHPKSPTAP